MTGTAWGIITALIGWIALNALGKPLLRFGDLRTETRRVTIKYGNVRARWHETPDGGIREVSNDDPLTAEDSERLRDAQLQFRDIASQMRAFADTQSPTCLLLRALGFDVRAAAAALMGMSNSIATYGKTRAAHTKAIETTLKFPGG